MCRGHSSRLSRAPAGPIGAAAQSVGVKSGGLPDLTIKEVKVYITKLGSNYHNLNEERGELISIATNSGIEGSYTLGNRNPAQGWLDWAKTAPVGESVVDVPPTLTSTSGLRSTYGFNSELYSPPGTPGTRYQRGNTFHRAPARGNGSAFDTEGVGDGLMTCARGQWPNWQPIAADVCLWDTRKGREPAHLQIIEWRMLGHQGQAMACASSTHHPAIEDYAPEALRQSRRASRHPSIHPGLGDQTKGAAIPA